ncbi:zinc finger protein 660 [Drosophila erecta]|uniref:zinc finger protein 660 n=1 Tax=Drosophila erecta TaxID=7220 RepID=UPI000F062778|nr:zinc finger protein 660 [Drosophila erecta]
MTMEYICRVCMGSHDDMVNIFEGTPGVGPSIPDMIAQWSGYQVEKGDSLPEHICPSCLEDAHNAFDIRQTSRIGHQCQVKVEAAEENSQHNVFCQVSNSASDKSNSSQKLDCPESLNEKDSNSIAERPGQQSHQPQKFGETDGQDDENSEISVGEYFPSDSNIREANASASDQSNKIQEDNFGDDVTPVDELDQTVDELKYVVPKSFILHDDSPERPHYCSRCGKSFARSCSFKNHLRTHAQDDNGSQSEHKQDIATFQETRKLQDQKCASSKHLQSSGRKFTCTYCPKTCSHQSDLKKHMRVHTEERPYSCNQCPKAFKQSDNPKRHMETHATIRKFNCNLCDSTFFSQSTFLLHMQEHEGIMPFKCHICTRAFKNCSSLKVHTRSHTGERPYSCSQCSKAYKHSIDLKRHIWTHDQEEGRVRDFRKFACTLCNKRFGTKYSLEVHGRTHSGEEPYRCDVCEKSFKYASSLKVHTRSHTGERPFVCDYCSKAFAQQIDLCRHIRIHTGERPHKCNQCESTFIDHSGLKAHLLVHTEERPYRCSQCQKAFKLLSILSRHMRTHTGEKRFKCEHCSKAYADRRSLRLHLPIHSGNFA